MMKKLLFASLFVLWGSAFAFAASPSIFFSDLTSGPKTGGQNGKGAFVTIVGRNFGASRGTSYVTVGGGQADNYPVWTDTKITFQLGANASTGAIKVVTPDGAAAGPTFTVRSGTIYFVSANASGTGSGSFNDPWKSPESYFNAMKAGDICYFRAGTYTGQYGNKTRPYNVSFYNAGRPNGSLNNEIAWVGYPNETALFKADDNTVYNGCFEFSGGGEYYVVAGLSLYSRGDGRGTVRLFTNNNKVVNCKVEGIKTLSYGMFEVQATAGTKIWGNEMYGAASGNKLDHIIYLQTGADNVDIGWNYMHNNDIGPGPVISINQDGGHNSGTVYQNIRIHDNRIDCRGSSDALRAIGTVDAALGGTVYIYNNVIIESGSYVNYYNAIYLDSCSVWIYNNTFYRSVGNNSAVINLTDSGSNFHPETVEIKNNIFYNQSNCGYVQNNSSYAKLTVSNNAYYGGAGSVPSSDGKAVKADPLFVNAGSYDFHLTANSPCINAGADTTAIAPYDSDGNKRVPGKISLGAFEFNLLAGASISDTGSTPLPPPVTPADIPGIVGPGEAKVVGAAADRGVVNPDRGEFATIYFRGSERGKYEVRIFTLTGQQVWESAKDNVVEDYVVWKPTGLASGIYTAHVKGPGINTYKKIAVLR